MSYYIPIEAKDLEEFHKYLVGFIEMLDKKVEGLKTRISDLEQGKVVISPLEGNTEVSTSIPLPKYLETIKTSPEPSN